MKKSFPVGLAGVYDAGFMETDPYSALGAMLRAARQERRLTLAQVEHYVHIRRYYLQSLESGDYSGMPGLAYTKGYLVAYAAFLDLDKDEILRRFAQGEANLARSRLYLPQDLSTAKTPPPRIVSGSLAAALGVYLLWMLVFSGGGTVSPVEHFPVVSVASPPSAHVTEIKGDNACLHRQDRYYPPCTMAQETKTVLLPLQGYAVSFKVPKEPVRPPPKQHKRRKPVIPDDEPIDTPPPPEPDQ